MAKENQMFNGGKTLILLEPKESYFIQKLVSSRNVMGQRCGNPILPGGHKNFYTDNGGGQPIQL